MTRQGLSIGVVAREAGLRPSALRYYERVGLIAPQLRARGRRQYDSSVLNVLALIGFARRAGFSIAETKLLLTGFGADVTASKRWRAMVSRKQSELDSVISDARRMKKLLQMVVDNCECPALEECGRQMRIRKEVTTT